MLHNNYIIIRNKKEDKKMIGEGFTNVEGQKDVPVKVEAQFNLILSLFWNSGSVRIKTNTQDVSEVEIGRSI